MIAVLSLFIIILLSVIVVRIATAVLVLTGLSEQSARFQAWSAFTGVGFTTHESESVINHPIRRRLTIVLMLAGNAAFVTIIAALLLSFLHPHSTSTNLVWRLSVLLAGVALLWLVSASRRFDQAIRRSVARAAQRWPQLDMRDYASLLRLANNHMIMEIAVRPRGWLAGRTLAELALAEEGIIVIGIQRQGGRYIASPLGRTLIAAGDVLLAYGSASALSDLGHRPAGPGGDEAHRKSAEEHRRFLHEQDQQASELPGPPAAGPT